MKRIAIYSSVALALGVFATSCNMDTEPRLDPVTPETVFHLEKSAEFDQPLIFRADETNHTDDKITFVAQAPEYGVVTVINYTVQLAKSEEDFKLWDKLAADQEGEEADNGSDASGLPLVYELPGVFTNPTITFGGDVFVEGVNSLYGFNADNYDGEYVPVAVRMHAIVPDVAYSSIYSNVIILEQVSSYIPITAPGVLYLIGAPQGWDINSGDMVLNETGIGTKIYQGAFEINAGDFQFRFYSALGDWETNSIGSQVDDQPIDITFEDNLFSGEVVMGKGTWRDSAWEGGSVLLTVNLKEMTVAMEKVEGDIFLGKKLYVIGACQGWDINSDALYLKETATGSNIFTGTIAINAGDCQFRFYTELGDWETNSIGSQVDDQPIDVNLSESYNGACVDGKGTWRDSSWGGGDLYMEVDLNSYSVTFEIP